MARTGHAACGNVTKGTLTWAFCSPERKRRLPSPNAECTMPVGGARLPAPGCPEADAVGTARQGAGRFNIPLLLAGVVDGDGRTRPRSGTAPLTVLTADGKAEQPALAGGGDATTAFTLEIQAAVDGIAAGKEPDLLSGKLARDALVLCHKECESVRRGEAVVVA